MIYSAKKHTYMIIILIIILKIIILRIRKIYTNNSSNNSSNNSNNNNNYNNNIIVVIMIKKKTSSAQRLTIPNLRKTYKNIDLFLSPLHTKANRNLHKKPLASKRYIQPKNTLIKGKHDGS